MTGKNKSRPRALWLAVSATLLTSSSALAVPAWYGANGGFIANGPDNSVSLPDFFQHQYWSPTPGKSGGFVSSNGWETQTIKPNSLGSGWCCFTSYDDIFYDLTSQGYNFKNLTDPTPANAWYGATYGPAPTANNPVTATSSNISAIASFFAGNTAKTVNSSMQKFLDQNINTNPADNKMATLISNSYTVINGNLQYYNYALKKPANTTSSIFDFTNTALKAGWEVLYEMSASPQVKQANQLWWNFHIMPVSGINTQNSTVFVADPDSNPNPNPPPATLGAPVSFPSPGTIPANLFTAPNAPLPVPAKPDPANAASYNSYYDDFTFNGSTVTSTQAKQFTNTTVAGASAIIPSSVKTINVKQKQPVSTGEDQTDITLQIPSTSDPLDGVLIEPSTLAVNPLVDPTSTSLIDDSDPVSIWTDKEDAQDPWGNADANQDDGIEYDLASGNPIEPGETVDLNLATDGDFSSLGYDILLHFQGDPSDEWLPEMFSGSQYDPSDYPSDDLAVPEPTALAPLAIGAAVALAGRRLRKGMVVG